MRSHPLGGVQDTCTKAVFVGMSVSVLTIIGVTVEDGVALTAVPTVAAVNVAVGKSNETVGGIGVGVA